MDKVLEKHTGGIYNGPQVIKIVAQNGWWYFTDASRQIDGKVEIVGRAFDWDDASIRNWVFQCYDNGQYKPAYRPSGWDVIRFAEGD